MKHPQVCRCADCMANFYFGESYMGKVNSVDEIAGMPKAGPEAQRLQYELLGWNKGSGPIFDREVVEWWIADIQRRTLLAAAKHVRTEIIGAAGAAAELEVLALGIRPSA